MESFCQFKRSRELKEFFVRTPLNYTRSDNMIILKTKLLSFLNITNSATIISKIHVIMLKFAIDYGR